MKRAGTDVVMMVIGLSMAVGAYAAQPTEQSTPKTGEQTVTHTAAAHPAKTEAHRMGHGETGHKIQAMAHSKTVEKDKPAAEVDCTKQTC